MGALLALTWDRALAPRSLRWALALPAAGTALFVAAWGDGIGAAPWYPWSFYHQARLVEAGLLLVVLPWVAQRALPGETDLQDLSALTGLGRSRLLAARWAVALSVVAIAAGSAAPVAILAQRMSGGPLTRVAADEAVWAALALMTIAAATWSRRNLTPVRAWVASMLVLGGTGLAIAPDRPLTSALGTAGAALLALVLRAAIADRQDPGLREDGA